MKKFDENGDFFTSDNPDETPEYINQSLGELIEMVDQKLETKPTGQKLLRVWRGEVNNLISEINKLAGRKMYSAV